MRKQEVRNIKYERGRAGTSLIDLLISLGIIAVLFGGIYLVYFSIVTAIGNVGIRGAAAAAIQQELEIIRNLPYANVGTIGGIPAGVIPQVQTVVAGNYSLTLQTTVLNIEDPWDETLEGDPSSTAPDADYKSVSIDATCPLCQNPIDVEITTTVAADNLESASTDGSLFLYGLDANGNPVSNATVHIVDALVTPSIDLTDTTNASGVLELVGVPTSTQSYSVAVTKSGYSTDQTNPPGAADNPNPVKPNLTVVAQTVTATTFAIDRVSQLSVYTSDNRCAPIGSEPFSIAGTKLIGTSPNILKFATSSVTDASGTAIFQNMEWDTYALGLTDAGENVAGTIPLTPITINPSSTVSFRFVVQPAANPSLLVTAIDSATGAGIANATATISTSGFSETLNTGHATFSQTNWSGQGESGYASQNGGVDAASAPGKITILANASGTYATGTVAWLTSNTFDVGGAASNFYGISWNPTAQQAQTGADSLEFQVAANNDNATWNFVGPDGTTGSYFTAAGALPPSLSGNRYFRYKAYLSTQDAAFTPEVDDISFDFSADCVPPAQALFTALPQGTYILDMTAVHYAENSTTVSVSGGSQSSTLLLVHL